MFEESPAADSPAEPQADTASTGVEDASDRSGFGIVLAVFAGTFLVAGIGYVLLKQRTKGRSMNVETDDEGRPDSEAETMTTNRGPSVVRYALVAFAAALIGAGLGAGATMLIAERGPEGAQGPIGAQGPRGEPGEAVEFDSSDLESRISDLEDSIEELDREQPIETDPDVVSDLEDLAFAITELQTEQEGDCDAFGVACTFVPPVITSHP